MSFDWLVYCFLLGGLGFSSTERLEKLFFTKPDLRLIGENREIVD